MTVARQIAWALALATASTAGWLPLLHKQSPVQLLTQISPAQAASTLAFWLVLWLLALRFARPIGRSFYAALLQDNANRYAGLLTGTMLAIAAAYVALALTPSHYAVGLQQLDVFQPPFLFEPRAVRSDEYAVLTPLFQTAVRGGLAPFNEISPYHESLKGFWALPISDWSLVFKPQLWGFWILPPAYAFSLYFAILWLSFLTGYTLLLTRLGADIRIAALGALCLLFSGYVQVWWTSNAPAFALAPWPAVVLMTRMPWWLKLPLLFWATAVWVFGFAYPPFILSGGFALGVLLLAFRSDALTPKNLALTTGAALALAGCFLLYFGDLIAVMQATVYPGSRISSGGGESPWKLVAQLLPYFPTMNLISLYNVNPCEIQVVSTLLPLTFICLVNYQALADLLKREWLAWSIIATGLLMMLAWIFLPVPAALGRLLLWTQVPPNRMLWGFGLLLTLSITLLASKCRFELTRWRMFAFASIMLVSLLVSKIGYTAIWQTTTISTSEALLRSTDEWIAILAFLGSALMAERYKATGFALNRIFLLSAAYTGILTFGVFNPVQRAFPIFDIPSTPFLEAARQEATDSSNGWAVLPRGGGGLMSGAGVPAINHVIVAPQLKFFRRFFPDMPDDAFNTIFNRYAYIVPLDDIQEPRLQQNDVILVPANVFRARPASRNVDGR